MEVSVLGGEGSSDVEEEKLQVEVKRGRNRDARESHSSTARKQEEEVQKCRKLDFPAPPSLLYCAPPPPLPVFPHLLPAVRPSSSRNSSRRSPRCRREARVSGSGVCSMMTD